MIRKTVPPSRVVPVMSLAPSAAPILSTGNPRVDHRFAVTAPARSETTSLDISSIATIALPSASCDVTTRRTFMGFLQGLCLGRSQLSGRLERLDFRLVVSDLRQDFIVVLADLGRV